MNLVETWLAPLVVTVVGGLIVGYLQRSRSSPTIAFPSTENNTTSSLFKKTVDAWMLVGWAFFGSMFVIFVFFASGLPPDHQIVVMVGRIYFLSAIIVGFRSVYEDKKVWNPILELCLGTFIIILFFTVIGWILGYGFTATQLYYFDVLFRYMW
jgi:hypothetical protein